MELHLRPWGQIGDDMVSCVGLFGMIHMHVFKYPMIERATGGGLRRVGGFLTFAIILFSLFGRGIPVSRFVFFLFFIYNMF